MCLKSDGLAVFAFMSATFNDAVATVLVPTLTESLFFMALLFVGGGYE